MADSDDAFQILIIVLIFTKKALLKGSRAFLASKYNLLFLS
ncbi:hypothetical protein J2T20_004536 [Paenibacillus wynnii]|nr:hypothetical protein [Paenibacillus wynnii]